MTFLLPSQGWNVGIVSVTEQSMAVGLVTTRTPAGGVDHQMMRIIPESHRVQCIHQCHMDMVMHHLWKIVRDELVIRGKFKFEVFIPEA